MEANLSISEVEQTIGSAPSSLGTWKLIQVPMDEATICPDAYQRHHPLYIGGGPVDYQFHM